MHPTTIAIKIAIAITITGGILKRKWPEKVCNSVPAVLVVCFDLSEEHNII